MNIELCFGLFMSVESEFNMNHVCRWSSENASPENLIIDIKQKFSSGFGLFVQNK